MLVKLKLFFFQKLIFGFEVYWAWKLEGSMLGACWVHVASLRPSAQDYSLFGDGLGLAGHTVPFLIVFLKMILQSLPDVLIHENIKAFPIKKVIQILLSVGLTMFYRCFVLKSLHVERFKCVTHTLALLT